MNKRYLEFLVQFVIFYSLITYYVELSFGYENTLVGHPFFLWSERVVAAFFTIEYICRWVASKSLKYPLTLVAIIDLIAIIPFYVGFFVDLRSLRVVRTLRVLRLLKLYRYHNALQRIFASFKKALPELGAIAFLVALFVLFSATFMLESEGSYQSDKFTNLGDAAWWSVVTMTTVGYGDLYPVTWLGRLTGVITIIFGVAVFSMFFSALQAAFVSNPDVQHKEDELKQMIKTLLENQAQLQQSIASLEKQLNPSYELRSPQ